MPVVPAVSGPCFLYSLYSLYLTLYKVDITLRQALRAGLKGVLFEIVDCFSNFCICRPTNSLDVL